MRGTAPECDHDPECDARTIARAEEIRRDKARMKGVKRHVTDLHRSVMGRKSKREKVRE